MTEIEHIRVDASELEPSPIPASWVLAGDPVARSVQWTMSRDGRWTHHVWECTAGSFRWEYGGDESVHVVEGGFRCRIDDGPWLEVGVGDTVLFRGGTKVEWVVDEYVRKHASFRHRVARSRGGCGRG